MHACSRGLCVLILGAALVIPVHPLRASVSACECVCVGFLHVFLVPDYVSLVVCGMCVVRACSLLCFVHFLLSFVCRCPRAYITLCRCLGRSVQPARIHLDVFVDVCMHVHV